MAGADSTTKSDDALIRIDEDGASENPDGERKTVTVLFADIKGSMELIEDLDPEEARAIVDPAIQLMIDAVQHYGGYVAQSTGDGIFALFGAPIAHEDHPQRALLAALRIQHELTRYSDRTRAGLRLPIQVRVGVNTGEVVVRTIKTGGGHTDYVPIGHSTSLAARMQALAPIGSIAATEQTKKLCEGYFSFTSLGAVRVKGVSGPVNVYQVRGTGPLRTRFQLSAERGLSRFVGRHGESEQLLRALEKAKEGHGQIVAVLGEPGVGKSRLFYEFKAVAQTECTVLETFALAHGKLSAYLPVIELLRNYFGIGVEDDRRRRREQRISKLLALDSGRVFSAARRRAREKVIRKLRNLDRSLEVTLQYVFTLLGIQDSSDLLAGIDGQVKRRRTQDAVRRILLRESLNQPLVVIFEDLHWIDSETQSFINLLAESIANAHVLLLVNYRPEYRHEWGNKSYYTQVRLDPLGPENVGEMLEGLLGDDDALQPVSRLIIDKSEGNPLFIEEMVQALFEQGVLVRDGAVKLARLPDATRLPPTVQGILAARIDRLPPEAKELLQTLAVIGSEFRLALVRQVVQLTADRLDQLLGVLKTGEFIYEQPATDDVEYNFKHALTHDEAYKSLLSERRKLLHERTAQAIEGVYSRRLEDHYADLARHYGSSSNVPKAIEYLVLAGEQALDRGAYPQSEANAGLALKLIERLPEGVERLRAELGVRLMEGTTAAALYGLASDERLKTLERVCQLSEQLSDEPALFRGLLNLGFTHSHRFEARRAQEIASRCVRLGEQDLREMLPAAHTLLAQALHRSGDLIQAASVGRNAMKALTSPRQLAAGPPAAYIWSSISAVLAVIELALGKPDEALKLGAEAVRRAREIRHSLPLATTLHLACLLRYERREPEPALELAEAVVALAEEHGFREVLVSGRALRAWATIELGEAEPGIVELESVGGPGQALLWISRSMLLAHAYLHVGRARGALVVVDEELARIERSGAYVETSELHRLKGEAILLRDASAAAAAEVCFRKAIEIAKGQSAKWWELRATVSLARLLRDTGGGHEARAMLTEIYDRFSEGFDSADLKGAKALLDELKS